MASDEIPELNDERPAPVTIVEPLKEIPLEGEGTDRAFETPDGTRFRARVRLTDRAHTKAPEGVDPALVAPTSMTLTLSIALLDENNAVQQAAGGYLIMPVHELQVSEEAWGAEGFDIEREIDLALSNMMLAAERSIGAKADALVRLEEAWGVTLPDPEPLPIVPIADLALPDAAVSAESQSVMMPLMNEDEEEFSPVPWVPAPPDHRDELEEEAEEDAGA